MLDEILKFEENDELLLYRFDSDGELIWPFVRFILLQSAINKSLNFEEAHFNKVLGNKKQKFEKYLTLILNALKKTPFKSKMNEIIIFTSDETNILRNDGKYFDRIQDDFAELFVNNTIIIEKEHNKQHHYPRHFKNIKYEDFINVLVKVKIMYLPFKKNQKDSINQFLNYIYNNFPIKLEKEKYNELKYQLYSISKRLKYEKYYYRKLFQNIKPKIIFCENGFYGKRAIAIKVANEMGIQTAEFQHGLVSLNHSAYNYGKSIFESKEYQKYMPKYYLTFGQYWSDNIRIPCEKVNIGSPHFTYKLQNYDFKTKKIDECKKILIISQGTVTKELVELAKKLSRKFKNNKYKIIYRLHPGEVGFKDRYESLYQYSNVIVNTSGDIYDLIYESDYIVGVSSTTLFESIGFNKSIFVYKHPDSNQHVGKNIGTWFKDSEELYKLINNNNIDEHKYNTKYYWNTNWEENYKKFINNILNSTNISV